MIVVFTAGSAGEGNRSVEEIRERLGHAQVQMYVVLVGHFFPVAPTSDLRKYAEPTGGDVYRVTDDDRATALHTAFARIIEQARASIRVDVCFKQCSARAVARESENRSQNK
jgi:hypothetical protein